MSTARASALPVGANVVAQVPAEGVQLLTLPTTKRCRLGEGTSRPERERAARVVGEDAGHAEVAQLEHARACR